MDRYWIAINRGSVAHSGRFPLNWTSHPRVSPTPQVIIGFETHTEMTNAHHILLHSPIQEANDYARKLLARKDLEIHWFLNPEAPEGQTVWLKDLNLNRVNELLKKGKNQEV